MPQPFHIGSQIGPYDPFWAQIREIVNQRAQQLGLYLIPIEIAGRPDTLPIDEQIGVVEELLAQRLGALICWSFPEKVLYQILESGLPVIYLSESKIQYPLFASPQGFYEAGRMIGEYFAKHLKILTLM